MHVLFIPPSPFTAAVVLPETPPPSSTGDNHMMEMMERMEARMMQQMECMMVKPPVAPVPVVDPVIQAHCNQWQSGKVDASVLAPPPNEVVMDLSGDGGGKKRKGAKTKVTVLKKKAKLPCKKAGKKKVVITEPESEDESEGDEEEESESSVTETDESDDDDDAVVHQPSRSDMKQLTTISDLEVCMHVCVDM